MRLRLLKGIAIGAVIATAALTTTALAGSGVNGIFNLGVTNSVNGASVLTGNTSTGPQLKVLNSNTAQPGIRTESGGGTGIALYGLHTTAGGSGPAIRGESASTAGNAFSIYGLLSATAPGSSSAAIRAESKSTSANGYGLWASQAGSGTGVYGTSATGIGVYGKHTSATGALPGLQGESASAAGAGVLAKNTGGGPALSLLVNSGIAPFAVNTQTKVANLNADLLDGFDGSAFWKLGGNAGTTPGTQFLGTTDSKALVFKTNGAEQMRLDPSGNLGIGTATPGATVDVAGGDLRVSKVTIAAEGFESASFPPTGWTTSGSVNWARDTGYKVEGDASAMTDVFGGGAVRTSDLATNATFPKPGLVTFYWQLFSNPGMSPGGELRFCIDGTCVRTLTSPTTWTPVVVSVAAGVHSFLWEVSVPAGANGVGAWLDAVSFDYGGSVLADALGIGVSTPTNILTVKQGSVTDPIADSWTTYSSRRWKTNVHTIEGALALIERLRGVRFDWRSDGKHDVGLIAEEVGKVLPELVTYEENGVDARGLDYARLVPILIQATKEQQRTIRSLRQRQAALEARLARVEQLVSPSSAVPGRG